MSTELVIGKQNSNISRSPYGPLGPFASPNQGRSLLSNDEFGRVLSFLGPIDLARSEIVCRNWDRFINYTGQWRQQCKTLLGVSTNEDLEKYRPKSPSSKGSLQMLVSSMIDGSVYESYIGKIGPVPRIPKEISLTRWNEADPCDPTKKIGTEYVWMYRPSHIEISVPRNSPLYLDGPDDANNPEAPRLIERTPEKAEGLLIRLAKKAMPVIKLKVPVTINNIEQLFKRPKIGNPSKYDLVWDKIVEQHGNKRIVAGWTCIKKEVIGRNLTYVQQLALANEKGVVPSDLATRILANCWGHVRSGEANVYPDGRNPLTLARTSTLTRCSQGNAWPTDCGAGGPSGLGVYSSDEGLIGFDLVGVGVALPAEVEAIGP